jgi:hypothetical protein
MILTVRKASFAMVFREQITLIHLGRNCPATIPPLSPVRTSILKVNYKQFKSVNIICRLKVKICTILIIISGILSTVVWRLTRTW